AREISSAETAWKAKIIFDSARHSRLSAGSFALDHHCAQSFARSVDSSSKTGWSTTYDSKIVEAFRSSGLQADVLCNVSQRRLSQANAVRKDHERKVVFVVFIEQVNQILNFRISLCLLDVEPLIGNVIACKEVFDVVRRGRPAIAEDANAI